MIEESGDNWYYVSPDDAPKTMQVIAVVRSVERTETIEREGKRKAKRPKHKPFGFAAALPKRK